MLGLHAERLADIVLTETESESIEYENVPQIEGEIHIQVQNVAFRYADNEPYVLENLNLEIHQGESVVFTGASGCGKSTLMNILTGSLKPESGTVTVNGHNIHRLPPSFIRGLSGTVMQDDVLFAGSISENISFFDESPNQELVVFCAQIAMIHLQ